MIGKSTAHSVVETSPLWKIFAGALVVFYSLVTITPLLWIFLTGLKSPTDSIAYPPKIITVPSLEGYCNLFTFRSRQTPEYIASLPPATELCDKIARERGFVRRRFIRPRGLSGTDIDRVHQQGLRRDVFGKARP